MDNKTIYNLYLIRVKFTNEIGAKIKPSLTYQCKGNIDTLKQDVQNSLYDENGYANYVAINPKDEKDVIHIRMIRTYDSKWKVYKPTVETY